MVGWKKKAVAAACAFACFLLGAACAKDLSSAASAGPAPAASPGDAVPAVPPVPPAPKPEELFTGDKLDLARAFEDAGVSTDEWGISVVDLDTGKDLFAHNAAKPFVSASTMKVITSWAAFETLKPNYVWETPVYITGSVGNGVLDGNLYIAGSGDPSFGENELRTLLRRVMDTGIVTIRGDLVIDRSRFADPKETAGDFDGKPYARYNALADALLVNAKSTEVSLFDDGEKLWVGLSPRLDGVTFSVPELGGGECAGWTETLGAEVNGTDIRLVGKLPRACLKRTFPVHMYPMTTAEYVGRVFKVIWRELGGTFEGQVKEGIVPGDATVRSVHRSQPLTALVYAMNKHSVNVTARNMLLTVAATGRTPATPEGGAAIVERLLKKKGIDPAGLVIENGSGLSRKEGFTAAMMTRVLEDAWKSEYRSELVSSLPVAGRDGTMRKRLRESDAAGRAHLKTGYIRNVRSLAGYVFAKDGKRYAMCVLVNSEKSIKAREAMNRLVEAVYDGSAVRTDTP